MDAKFVGAKKRGCHARHPRGGSKGDVCVSYLIAHPPDPGRGSRHFAAYLRWLCRARVVRAGRGVSSPEPYDYTCFRSASFFGSANRALATATFYHTPARRRKGETWVKRG